MQQKTIIKSITLTPIKSNSHELFDEVHYECGFCKKSVFSPQVQKWCNRLSGDEFYCSFCLKNNFHTRNNKHILVMSFCSIFAHYYYQHYKKNRKICRSEIEDRIKKHVAIGLENPVFYYDPETYYWFIDFSRIGRRRKKLKLSDVLNTVFAMAESLKLRDLVNNYSMNEYKKKLEIAITKFYTHRQSDSNFFIPTLPYVNLKGDAGVVFSPEIFL